jgi:hypothetical protein
VGLGVVEIRRDRKVGLEQDKESKKPIHRDQWVAPERVVKDKV